VYIYLNKGNRHFEKHKVAVTLPANAVPFQVAVADIDHDGHPDLYISNFVEFSFFRSATFNDPTHAKHNVLLHNNGDMTFTDITALSGTAGTQNTFSSTFVDLDNDGWQDLVVANNTGEVEIFRNKHNLTFEKIKSVSRLGFWMGVGVGDIDKDGYQDLFFPNVGSSIPEFLTKGDLRPGQIHTHDWLLLHNDGQFHFTDVTRAYGLDDEAFGWGGVFEDMASSGQLALFVAENYIKWPLHKLFKLKARAFVMEMVHGQPMYRNQPEYGLENPYFGQSSVIVDLDGDGRQDFMWINMEGPIRAFINKAAGNYVTVKVPTSARYLGARIHVEFPSGRSYTREVIASQGFMTGQNPEYNFGLGRDTIVQRIVIEMPDGSSQVIKDPKINTKISIK
jgi:enediyne biosynthesis protein E4